LVLIPFCLARATRAGASPAEAPATRAAGHAASAIPSGAFPDLAARPLSAEALSNLLDRKPHLLRSLAIQLLPPPLSYVDPAKRLGIDLSSMRTAEDIRWVMPTVLAAIARGEISPAEGADIARRVRRWLRWIRKLARATSINRNREKQPAGRFAKGYVANPSRRAGSGAEGNGDIGRR